MTDTFATSAPAERRAAAKARVGHDAKIEEAVRRRWPGGQIEAWRRPSEVFKLIDIELEAMGCKKKEGGIPSLSTKKRWWAARGANADAG